MESGRPTSESGHDEDQRAESVGMRVVDAIAELEDVDSVDLDVPLNDVIDPDALDALFAPSDWRTNGHIEFTYAGYSVVVRSTGEVTVDGSSVDSGSRHPSVSASVDD